GKAGAVQYFRNDVPNVAAKTTVFLKTQTKMTTSTAVPAMPSWEIKKSWRKRSWIMKARATTRLRRCLDR
ncbi:MAG TPA: hypothetical protein DIW40_00360, partial [Halomonas sp.]|nr:hypothetical protein [Halomonas sp.]